MARSTQRGESNNTAKREQIIEVAAQIFYTKGYDATTTKDIADAVGMLKGSLYYYISTKEDLLYEIIERVHRSWAANLNRVSSVEGDALTRIWVFVYANTFGNAVNLVDSAVFFHDFRSMSGERRDEIVKLRDIQDQFLRDLIAEGQAEHQVRKGIDAKVNAIAILTMCNALYQWFNLHGQWTAEQIAQWYADIAVAGLVADPAALGAAKEKGLAIVADWDDLRVLTSG